MIYKSLDSVFVALFARISIDKQTRCRLKQMQKEDSHKRKTLLRKERNQIKYQLLADMLPKLKRGSHRERNERRLSGPLKVIQTSGTTTVHSETSLSKGTAGTDQEVSLKVLVFNEFRTKTNIKRNNSIIQFCIQVVNDEDRLLCLI